MFLAFPLRAVGQDAADPKAALETPKPRQRLRERLAELPNVERTRFERNLEQFERLPRRTRARLLERASALREREQALDEALTNALRKRLKERGGREHESARELWRTWLREDLKQRGRELRARLPERLRHKLDHAPLEVRQRYFERLRDQSERVARLALGRMRERFGLSPREVQRLERLPLPERLRALCELRRSQRIARG
jgi:hypothetical protein